MCSPGRSSALLCLPPERFFPRVETSLFAVAFTLFSSDSFQGRSTAFFAASNSPLDSVVPRGGVGGFLKKVLRCWTPFGFRLKGKIRKGPNLFGAFLTRRLLVTDLDGRRRVSWSMGGGRPFRRGGGAVLAGGGGGGLGRSIGRPDASTPFGGRKHPAFALPVKAPVVSGAWRRSGLEPSEQFA